MGSKATVPLQKQLEQTVTQAASLNQRLSVLLRRVRADSGDPMAAEALDVKLQRLRTHFGTPDDLIIRTVRMRGQQHRLVCVYFAGFVREDALAEQVLNPLSIDIGRFQTDGASGEVLEQLAACTHVPNTGVIRQLQTLTERLHSGYAVILVDGVAPGLALGLRGGEHRRIEDPPAEPTILGSRTGFVEDMDTNLSLVRRHVRTPNLRYRTHRLGNPTSSRVSVIWLDGIARPELVAEMMDRVGEINPDVVTLGAMGELIGDSPWSIFPTMLSTERVDYVEQALLRGQIAIILENQPFVMVAPTRFFDFLKSPDDLNFHFLVGSMLRFIRLIAVGLALLAPGMYVAVTTYHHELIPAELLFNVASGREGVPLPPVLEALSMELAVEILREAGSRMPRAIGPAVSIVGVLLLGDAAIQASLVSPLMLVVVGTTVLAQFLLPYPHMVAAVRNVRILFVIMAGFMGLFGLLITLAFLVTHLTTLRSLGVPYLAPVAPAIPGDMGSLITRLPWWQRVYRPRAWTSPETRQQQPQGQMARPEVPEGGNGP